MKPFMIIIFLAAALLFIKLLLKNIHKNVTVKKIDKMTGIEFENYLKRIFASSGYRAYTTPKSNDYGADLILIKDHERTVVQVKRYNSAVGISAVQEVYAAIPFYKANKAAVITNSTFTKNAKKLAKADNVALYDRTWLYRTTTQKYAKLDSPKEHLPETHEITVSYNSTIRVPLDVDSEIVQKSIERYIADIYI